MRCRELKDTYQGVRTGKNSLSSAQVLQLPMSPQPVAFVAEVYRLLGSWTAEIWVQE